MELVHENLFKIGDIVLLSKKVLFSEHVHEKRTKLQSFKEGAISVDLSNFKT